TLSTSSSLSDHLLWQLSMQTDDPTVREIGSAIMGNLHDHADSGASARETGAAIIGNLDDDGYLVASFEELAAMGPWPVSEVERALKLVQSFDPTGVA